MLRLAAALFASLLVHAALLALAARAPRLEPARFSSSLVQIEVIDGAGPDAGGAASGTSDPQGAAQVASAPHEGAAAPARAGARGQGGEPANLEASPKEEKPRELARVEGGELPIDAAPPDPDAREVSDPVGSVPLGGSGAAGDDGGRTAAAPSSGFGTGEYPGGVGSSASRAGLDGGAPIDTAALARLLRARAAHCYPRLARRRAIEGTVRVRFRISGDGSAEAIELLESSGHAILDEAAIDCVVRGAEPLPQLEGALRVPIAFQLR